MLFLLLVACVVRAESAVNPNLTGKLFLGGEGEGWLLDLQQSTYSRVPGVDWEGTSGMFPGLANFSSFPLAFDGRKHLTLIENCRRSSNPKWPSRFDDCLAVYSNGANRVEKTLPFFQDIIGQPKLSRDGNYSHRGGGKPARLSTSSLVARW